MQRLFREHLKRALRNLSIGIIGILLAAIGLSLIGNDNLNVPLGTQGPTLQQRHFVLNASAIDIPTRLYIIQSIGYNRKLFEETITEGLFSGSADFL